MIYVVRQRPIYLLIELFNKFARLYPVLHVFTISDTLASTDEDLPNIYITDGRTEKCTRHWGIEATQ